jgi:hypothetical protein
MRYSDGQEAKVGDKVQCWDGCIGVVVASMDTDEYSAEHPREAWGHLAKGVMIDTDKAGLIHYTEPEPTMVLLERRPGAAT